jgi:hypothetical protein
LIKLDGLELLQSIEITLGFRLKHLTHTWNGGMMEYWNVVLKNMLFIYLILCEKEFYNTQLPIFPEHIIPLFQL